MAASLTAPLVLEEERRSLTAYVDWKQDSELAILSWKRRSALAVSAKSGVRVIDALDFAHTNGVIHRDVKPSNIFVGSDGQAYLADFGITLVLGKPRITHNIGTPAYMSPEQIKARDLDHRTDVHSFGCVLYEMLASRPPSRSQEEGGIKYEIMRGHVEEAPLSLRRINREVDGYIEAVVFQALAKDPNTSIAVAERWPRHSPSIKILPPITTAICHRVPKARANTQISLYGRGYSVLQHSDSLLVDATRTREWQPTEPVTRNR